MRIPIIISLWIATFALSAEAQDSWRISGKSICELRRDTLLFASTLPSATYSGAALRRIGRQRAVIPKDITKIKVPSAYSYEHLGLFCKWEVQIERKVGLPVKFRLGEVQYVERLEGKY